MTGLPNFAVGPVTLTSILYPQPAVDIRHMPTEKLGYHEIKTNISSAYENLAIFSRHKLFELSHLKMGVPVSEPCDVIRVGDRL